MKTGRKPNPERQAWMDRFGLSEKQARNTLTERGMEQLRLCRSDEARRLILGIRPGAEGSRP